jgi:hypothetical protein
MATLGTVYDADPAPRRPHDVMTPAITLHAANGNLSVEFLDAVQPYGTAWPG